MTLEATDLLAGPRGRRLCLEVALQGDDDHPALRELRSAVFFAAYDLDPGRGTSRVMFGATPDERSAYTPEDVGRLLQSLPLPEPTEHSLLLALASSVNAARYWQEPDGEDVLTGTPEVLDPLARIAGVVVRSRHTTWWAQDLERDEQWVVAFEGTDLPDRPSTRTAAETSIEWREAQVEEEVVAARDRPTSAQALWSGTWWSRPASALERTTRTLPGAGPVGLRLVEDALGWGSARTERVKVPHDPRVVEIDGPDAWARLCRRYPLEVTASRRHDWYRTTGRDGRWVMPDWARASEDIDAVHLSVGGYLTTAGRAIDVDGDSASVVAGWDPDQTWWLCDVERVAATERIWRYDQSADDWLPEA